VSRTPTQNSFPELPFGNLVAEEHADDGDEDVVSNRADDDGTQARADGDPVDRFVGAAPWPESPGSVIVADDDGYVRNECRNKNRQRDRRDDHNQSDGTDKSGHPSKWVESNPPGSGYSGRFCYTSAEVGVPQLWVSLISVKAQISGSVMARNR
jgi:hypothetical protein